jgi:hypothetical protein
VAQSISKGAETSAPLENGSKCIYFVPLHPCMMQKAAARAVCAVANRIPNCQLTNKVTLVNSKISHFLMASYRMTAFSQINLDGQYN